MPAALSPERTVEYVIVSCVGKITFLLLSFQSHPQISRFNLELQEAETKASSCNTRQPSGTCSCYLYLETSHANRLLQCSSIFKNAKIQQLTEQLHTLSSMHMQQHLAMVVKY